MWEVIDVYLDGATDPVEVTPITVDVVLYRRLCDREKVGAYPAGMSLLSAYCRLTDRVPIDLKEVDDWARKRMAICVLREGEPNTGPTNPATPAG